MLSQVELGKSTPTINVLWRIARALGISFSALLSDDQEPRSVVLRAGSSKVLTSHDGGFVSRALFPTDGPRKVEFYELRLAARSIERAEPHPLGTKENLVVARGLITVVIGGERHGLDAGDAIFFAADVAHEYRNDGDDEALVYLVVTYERREARAFDARRASNMPHE
jgi:quercetin dioxygenase-like cupin family protein